MPALRLPLHQELRATSRLRSLTSPAEAAGLRDWLLLLGIGVVAALASTLLDFRLRIPGHAILRAVFPMAVGLAAVPRRGAGCVMGASALVSGVGLRMGGFTGSELSLGALTSLAATGPLLDWTLRRARGGWRLYAGIALAGLFSNLLALVIRGASKAWGLEHAGARPLASWLPQAAVTYVICGLLAGLVSGAVWFYARPRGDDCAIAVKTPDG